MNSSFGSKIIDRLNVLYGWKNDLENDIADLAAEETCKKLELAAYSSEIAELAVLCLTTEAGISPEFTYVEGNCCGKSSGRWRIRAGSDLENRIDIGSEIVVGEADGINTAVVSNIIHSNEFEPCDIVIGLVKGDE